MQILRFLLFQYPALHDWWQPSSTLCHRPPKLLAHCTFHCFWIKQKIKYLHEFKASPASYYLKERKVDILSSSSVTCFVTVYNYVAHYFSYLFPCVCCTSNLSCLLQGTGLHFVKNVVITCSAAAGKRHPEPNQCSEL